MAPVVEAVAAALDRRGASPAAVTAAGLGVGIAACVAAGFAAWPLALVLWLTNRVLDGLDGPLARRRGATDLGGFVDFTADFVVYGGFVIGVAVAVPEARMACCVLLAAYLLNNVAQLSFASLVEKRRLSFGDERSLRFTPGLTEGTETVLAYAAFCLLPAHAPAIAWVFAAMVLFTAASVSPGTSGCWIGAVRGTPPADVCAGTRRGGRGGAERSMGRRASWPALVCRMRCAACGPLQEPAARGCRRRAPRRRWRSTLPGREDDVLGTDREGRRAVRAGHRHLHRGASARSPSRDLAAQQVRHAEEACNGRRDRPLEQLARLVMLDDAPLQHQRDALAQFGGLGAVVRDDDRRELSLALESDEELPQLRAAVGIHRRQRLVQQEQCGVGAEGAGERHALLLSAGEPADAAVGEADEPDVVEAGAGACAALAARDARGAERERDVLGHVEVRQKSRLLEDDRDATLVGRNVGKRAAASADHAGVERGQPGDRAQQRRLARARRADERCRANRPGRGGSMPRRTGAATRPRRRASHADRRRRVTAGSGRRVARTRASDGRAEE